MLLAQALALHQSGRRAEAEAAYRALLAAEPGNAEALHAYGVLRHQSGDSASAVVLFDQAIAQGIAGAECWFNMGLAQFKLGAMAQAEAAFGRAAGLKPDWPEPHYDLANTYAALGKLEEAAREYRAALRLRPDFVRAAVNLGNVLKQAGRLDQAVSTYRRVLRSHADLADVHNNLGTALQLQGDTKGAAAAFREAIRLRPDFAEALGSLVALLGRAGWFAEALPVAQAASAVRPGHAPYVEMHADALRGLARYKEARAIYREALALDPGRHTARFGLAESYRLERNADAAERELRMLAADLPDAWQWHHDLANILRDRGKFAEAEAAYRAALALNNGPVVLNHLGAVLRDQHKLDEAFSLLSQAAAMAPKDEHIRYNLSITHLTAGRLREGFALYDSRFVKFKVRPLPGRPWAGENPRGRTILVADEQGMGDTLQFLRYVPPLAATGARIVLRVPPAFQRLLQGFPGPACVFSQEQKLPVYDYFCHVMSLPHLLRLTDPMPVPVPYLHADPAAVARWRARLEGLPGRKIGLVWAGNPTFAADHLRSIPLPALAALGAAPGVSFVSLQKNAAALPDFPIADFTAELNDLADTAALIAALDLVISVDTGVAHLAGAIGAPVWVLNRSDTCWRWLSGRDDSIWYPSLRLFRQSVPGDWSAPLHAVLDGLAALVASEGPA
jgi:tetratricopeptide (TPR) repeat protein